MCVFYRMIKSLCLCLEGSVSLPIKRKEKESRRLTASEPSFLKSAAKVRQNVETTKSLAVFFVKNAISFK